SPIRPPVSWRYEGRRAPSRRDRYSRALLSPARAHAALPVFPACRYPRHARCGRCRADTPALPGAAARVYPKLVLPAPHHQSGLLRFSVNEENMTLKLMLILSSPLSVAETECSR